jgi:antitoxin (DNA-binding transcriptional repressor) of toxin-antitoxin stability system
MAINVDAIPTTITERELAERLSEILDRVANGEQIVIERDGTAIVVLEPAPEPKKYWTWGEFVHWLQHESSFDEEFAEAVRSVRASQGPARAAEWPD